MARYLKSSIYIHYLLRITIHLPPFINHLKITLKVTLKQKKINHFIVPKFVIVPVKGFQLLREMQECRTALFHRKKTKKKYQKSKEDMLFKFIFVI